MLYPHSVSTNNGSDVIATLAAPCQAALKGIHACPSGGAGTHSELHVRLLPQKSHVGREPEGLGLVGEEATVGGDLKWEGCGQRQT